MRSRRSRRPAAQWHRPRGRRQRGRREARRSARPGSRSSAPSGSASRSTCARRRRRAARAHARLDEGHRLTLWDAIEPFCRTACSTCSARTSTATARCTGRNARSIALRDALSRSSRWQASGGVRDAADLARARGVRRRRRHQRQGAARRAITPEELRPFLPNASSPASTSATARSSRACASATTASWATSSSSRRAIATKARTSSCSTTSRRAPKAAPSIATGSAAWRAVLDIPFCVAGGIRSVADAEAVLNAGAEKISVNSPALADPGLIDELARASARSAWCRHRQPERQGRLSACTSSPAIRTARSDSGRDTLAWVREVQERGAGEIVLNCMASDGVRRGYDVEQLTAVRAVCDVPLVASGGAGAPEHFRRRVREGARRCGAGRERVSLGRHRHSRLKTTLAAAGIEVRP